MSTFKEKIVEMASLLGGGYHDEASVRAVIGKIVGR
jgi:acetoin utilization deacetylase AcuC-like enzyme